MIMNLCIRNIALSCSKKLVRSNISYSISLKLECLNNEITHPSRFLTAIKTSSTIKTLSNSINTHDITHSSPKSVQIANLTTDREPDKRRRRRKKIFSNLNNGNNSNESMMGHQLPNTHTNVFKTGHEGDCNQDPDLSIQEYLEIASLSPWVPTPDPVARRMLEIGNVCSDDIHYELGSGDGRLNFMAIDEPFHVKSSTGIEIDDSLLQMSMNRLNKRYPKPTQLTFMKADLMPIEISDDKDETKEPVLDSNSSISTGTTETNKKYPVDISDATVVTMYFVEDALKKLKPMLEDQLLGTNCRIVTCGYEVEGWDPAWVELVLGLPIYLYKMDNSMNRMENVFSKQQKEAMRNLEDNERVEDQIQLQDIDKDLEDDIFEVDNHDKVDSKIEIDVENKEKKSVKTNAPVWKFSK